MSYQKEILWATFLARPVHEGTWKETFYSGDQKMNTWCMFMLYLNSKKQYTRQSSGYKIYMRAACDIAICKITTELKMSITLLR